MLSFSELRMIHWGDKCIQWQACFQSECGIMAQKSEWVVITINTSREKCFWRSCCLWTKFFNCIFSPTMSQERLDRESVFEGVWMWEEKWKDWYEQKEVSRTSGEERKRGALGVLFVRLWHSSVPECKTEWTKVRLHYLHVCNPICLRSYSLRPKLMCVAFHFLPSALSLLCSLLNFI